MDWLDKMNSAMDHIENHLADEIDYFEVARVAMCSEYHFRRMFPFMTGISLSEYIRRRRLSLAASELSDCSKPVADIARKYGYDSPDSFTRAFKNWHGVTPSDVRKGGQTIKSYPKMIFHLSIKGGTEMKHRIIDKEAFTIVGITKRVQIQFEGENPEVAAMWRNLSRDTIQKLKSLSNIEPKGLIRASTNFDEGRMDEKGRLDHYIGVDEKGNLVEVISEGDCLKQVVRGKYANSPQMIGKVGDFMTPDPVTISPGENIMQAAQMSLKLRLRRFPVLDDGKLVGQISQRDVIAAMDTLKNETW